ncbi:MAG: hypothetical protein AB7I25_09715 [Vicinamibacterales bacterium]
MARMRALVAVFLAVLFLSVLPAHAQAPEDVDITGVYRCDGVNPQGKAYRGMVEIVRMNDAFQLRWTFPQSSDAALGIGIISNGVLAVSYYGGDLAGVVVYKINDDKPMVGEWTVIGSEGGVFRETLTRLPGHGPSDGPPADGAPRRPTIGDPSKAIQG